MATNAGLIDIKLRAGFDKGAMNNAVREVGKNMELMSSRVKSAGNMVTRTMGVSVLPFGAALAGAFAFGSAAAVRFEDEFANVKKTLDVTGEASQVEASFKVIAQQLRDIAKFSPASISELTQIAAVGGQLGIAASDIVKFTDTIQKLTVATNMGAEAAAMGLARLQKITNLAASDIDNLGSVIVKLGNNFATTESEIVTAATQIATATAGIQTQFNNAAVDAVAFATALRAVGQPAQAGSTAIIRLIQVMDRLVDSGGKGLANVARVAGMSVESFQALFDIDPAQGLAAFIEGLGKFEDEGKDAIAILEGIGLGQIRTRRGIMALARAKGDGGLGLLSEALRMANKEFTENQALLTEAERRYETVASQLKILKNIVNEAGIAYGENFLPFLNNTTQALANFITSVTNFSKRTKDLFGMAILAPFIGGIVGLRKGFKLLTQDTLEWAAATNLVRTGMIGLTAEQQRLMFTTESRERGMSLFANGPLGGLQTNKKGGLGGTLLNFGRGVRQSGKPGEFTSPHDIFRQVEFGKGGQGTLFSRTMSDEFLRVNDALGKVAEKAGVSKFKFLRLNMAFKDSGKFMENFADAIKKYNKGAGKSIAITNTLQGGMMGLAAATRAVGAAVSALFKQLAVFIAISVGISKIFEFIERRGARTRSIDQFASSIDGITESLIELETARKNLTNLENLEKELLGTGDTKNLKIVQDMIKDTASAIDSKDRETRNQAGASIKTLLYGQEGGAGLEDDIKNTAKDLGVSIGTLEDNLFSGMSSIVTDIHTGKLPTVGTLVEEMFSVTTGDRKLDRAIDKVSESMDMVEFLQSRGRVSLAQNLGVSKEDAKRLDEYAEIVKDTFELASGTKLKGFRAADAADLFTATSALIQAKGKALNDSQRALIAEGALDEKAYIDATVSLQQQQMAQQQVSEAAKKAVGDAAQGTKDWSEELGITETAVGQLADMIDDSLTANLNNAMDAMAKLPDAMEISSAQFMKNLQDNFNVTETFNRGIQQLANIAPLLANLLAQKGPEARHVLEGFLQDTAGAVMTEGLLSRMTTPELSQQSQELRDEYEQIGNSIGEGIVKGVENQKTVLEQIMTEVIEEGIVNSARDYLDIYNPSRLMEDEVGTPIIEGIVRGIEKNQFKLSKAMIFAMEEMVSSIQDDFSIYTDLMSAQRGVTQAKQNELQAQIGLNAAYRESASYKDRFLKVQKELNKAEIEGRQGNVTINEEISILRKKINLEKQVKAAGGNKSAKELLAIQRAEENISDLRAMANKGVISNLELQAAEEDLARLKGTDMSDDERQLIILELAAAEKDLQETREKALAQDDRVVTLRQEMIGLMDEEILMAGNVKIAQEQVAAAKEGVINADLRLEEAVAAHNNAIKTDSEYMNNLNFLNDTYGYIEDSLRGIVDAQGLVTAGMTAMSGAIVESVAFIQDNWPSDMFGFDEYRAFQKALGGDAGGSTTYPYDMGNLEENMRKFFDDLGFLSSSGQLPPGYGMGGRVKGYKYGGRGDPMTRALVGEYGPEEVRFVPGNGFLVKPLGTGKSGTVVNSLNVNVTGVPSDPISARKAAVQISKALRRLDKEGSSGTGLRRN